MQFRILGPLEAQDGDRRLDLGAPGQRAVLTVLLLHANEIVPTDRLADDLWPGGVPRTAAKTIQVYVSNLRKALGAARDALLIVQHTTGVVAEPLLGRPGKESIAELAQDAGLLVLGLSERWRTEGLGATRSALVAAPPAPTVLVRRGLRPSGIAPPAALTRFTWSIEQSTIGL